MSRADWQHVEFLGHFARHYCGIHAGRLRDPSSQQVWGRLLPGRKRHLAFNLVGDGDGALAWDQQGMADHVDMETKTSNAGRQSGRTGGHRAGNSDGERGVHPNIDCLSNGAEDFANGSC